MKKIITILLILSLSVITIGQNKKQYQYNNNIPTKYGIQHYVNANKNNVVKLVQDYIKDTIYSYDFKVEDLSEYSDYDSLKAGRFYPENEIIITNELKYYDYELNFVPKWKQKEYRSNTKFVKAVLIHELIHLYLYQYIYDCLGNNVPINTEYINFNTYPNRKSKYASEFIEEGICEYVVMKLKEGIFSDYKLNCIDGYSEANIKKFVDIQNTYDIKYQYSRTFVQKIFDNNDFKTALLIIFTCKPPTYQEMLCPNQYYYRLQRHAENMFCNYDFKIL